MQYQWSQDYWCQSTIISNIGDNCALTPLRSAFRKATYSDDFTEQMRKFDEKMNKLREEITKIGFLINPNIEDN